jgi:hypothetical protein
MEWKRVVSQSDAVREAAVAHVAGLQAHGDPVPEPATIVEYVSA